MQKGFFEPMVALKSEIKLSFNSIMQQSAHLRRKYFIPPEKVPRALMKVAPLFDLMNFRDGRRSSAFTEKSMKSSVNYIQFW